MSDGSEVEELGTLRENDHLFIFWNDIWPMNCGENNVSWTHIFFEVMSFIEVQRDMSVK